MNSPKLWSTTLPLVLLFALMQILAGFQPTPVDAAALDSSATWNAADAPLAPITGEGAVPMTEVSVAIDPTDPDNMVATQIVYGNPPQACCSRGIWRVGWSTSDDGGASWTYRGLMPAIGHSGEPMVCDDPASFDPWLTFDADGIAYLSYASTGAGIPSLNACGDSTLTVARSFDSGVTWETPVVVARADTSCFSDRDAVAAHPSEDILYVAWSGLGCPGDPIYISRSVDGGLTWSERVVVNLPDDAGPYGASPRVGPDGTVYVAYYRGSAFDGCINVVGSASGSLYSAEAVVARSTDGGASWTHTVIGPVCDTEYQTHEIPFSGGGEFAWPMFAVDPKTGFAAIAWLNRDHPFTTIHVSTSSDGVSWSPIQVVSDEGRSLLLPAIGVAEGVIRLAYVSMVTTGEYEVRYRESSDGASWTAPVALTTGPSCSCWSQVNGPYLSTPDIGHYIGLDARAGAVAVVWPDNRDPLYAQTIFGRGGSYGG